MLNDVSEELTAFFIHHRVVKEAVISSKMLVIINLVLHPIRQPSSKYILIKNKRYITYSIEMLGLCLM